VDVHPSKLNQKRRYKMSELFKISEVVEMAVLIETNGEVFYNSLQESAQDAQAREVFAYLAGEEKRHKATFEKMGESLAKYQPVESYPGEYAAYMKALADDNVFTQRNVGGNLAQKATSAMEAVDMALKFEKDSILFFEGMRRFVPEKKHPTIDKMIEEEKTHIVKLKELKEKLAK